ncbi:LysR substrate-binding domain-containing protein, partial [Pseudomonas syringae pv. tagetis]|uniref:LysR substrate-binding domain-containing protein n=1 Tax=Pseudomonas syringae group genomosp. 7 TaxID=251699 RepID=UPI00376FC897
KTLRIETALLSNDGSVARRWAEQGAGIVLRSQWDVSDAIASGSLVRVLADWQLASAPINQLVPVRKHRTARVQALME